MSKIDLTKNMAIRPEVLGNELLLVHAPQTIAGQRVTMVSGHLSQAVTLNKSDLPQWFTGYEEPFGKYRFNSAELTEPVMIRKVIAKYTKHGGNPMLTVVYTGMDSRQIGYFQIKTYEYLSQGFGYNNNWINNHLLTPGTIIQPNTEFTQPSNHDDNLYGIGINARVAHMTLRGTVEDANILSASTARRLGFTRFFKYTIDLPIDVIPLNLYGDNCMYSCFPDIGCDVLANGILMATRPIDACGFADITDDRLHIVQPLQDSLYRVANNTNARVVDIDVYMGKQMGKDYISDPRYEQFKAYHEQQIDYFNKIVTTYSQLVAEGNSCGVEFNDLVTKAIGFVGVSWRNNVQMDLSKETTQMLRHCFSVSRGSRDFGLYDTDTEAPVEFLRIELMVSHTAEAYLGSKTTGRDGCKGVCSQVLPDEDMPVDDFGIAADIVICPRSNISRLVGEPLHEQFFNRAAEFVKRQALALEDPLDQLEYILDYLNMLDPEFSKLVREELHTPELVRDYLKTVREDRIYYRIPPCTSMNLLQLVENVTTKYNVVSTPVTYVVTHDDGTKETIRTNESVMIGEKYIMMLNKIPADSISGISVGYLNQHLQPVKPSPEIRKTSPVSRSATRWGEDERWMMNSRLGKVSSRLQHLYGGSYDGVVKLATELLTNPHPSQLKHIDMPTAELIDTSSPLSICNHAMGVTGISIKEDKPN